MASDLFENLHTSSIALRLSLHDDVDTLRIAFIDFWPGFQAQQSDFSKFFTWYHKNARPDREISFTDDYVTSDIVVASLFGNEVGGIWGGLKMIVDPGKLVVYTGEAMPPHDRASINVGFDYGLPQPRYFRIPLWLLGFTDHNLDLPSLRGLTPTEIERTLNRPNLIGAVVSNPNCPERNAAMEAFPELISGGRHRNNIGGPVNSKAEVADRVRFLLAFENQARDGYTTEKLPNARTLGCVPIYWGGFTDDFDRQAYVDASAFRSVSDLVSHVRALSNESIRAMLQRPLITDEVARTAKRNISEWIDALFELRDRNS